MMIQESISADASYIVFRNGSLSSYGLNNSNVISASVKRQACSGNTFDTGGVYAAQLSLKCLIPSTNSFRLRGARIHLRTRYGSEASGQPVGVFWITDAKKIAGDIYQITALDAVGWLDSSSFNASTEGQIFDSVSRYMESQGKGYPIDSWCAVLTDIVNSLAERLTGEHNVLIWQNYDESVNGVFTNHYAMGGYGNDLLYYFLSTESGSGLSACPRDLFRHLAKLAGGFIFASESGKLTLGQFSMPEFGKAEISDSEIQQDSCEIADYVLQTIVVTAQSEIENGKYNQASSTVISDYSSLSPVRFQYDSNPFLDGFAAGFCRGDSVSKYPDLGVIVNGLYAFQHRFRYAGNMQDVIQTAELRPFSCTVHSEQRFHIGQKIGISHHGSYYESEITSATWNFRGGWNLSCAGADSRSMADALRSSRADKAMSEARNRCITLEKKLS